MQIRDFVANYISSDFGVRNNFTGSRGWVHLTNLLLKQFERRGYFSLDRKKEIGVEVDNYHWITYPSDCRNVLKIFNPFEEDQNFRFDVVNGKIKLDRTVEKKASPDTFTLSSFTASSVAINDTDAEADQWIDYLLIASDKRAIVSGNTAVSGGLSTLSFLHNVTVSSPMPTSGYLTDQYLILQYMSVFTGLTSETDEIPIDDRYEDVLAQGLLVNVMSKADKRFKGEYQLFADMIMEIEAEMFSPETGSIKPRRLIGYETVTNPDDEYIGDTEE